MCLTSRRSLLIGTCASLSMSVLLPRAAYGKQAESTPRLLVRGETDLIGEEMAWRVVQDSAEVAPDAGYQRRALGFTINTSIFTDLLLTDEMTESGYRLAPGEAAFNAEGNMQRRESLGDAPEQYLRVALVQAELAGDAGGDHIVFSGSPFTTQPGPVMLTLGRYELDARDRAYAVPGAGQALILVLQGEVEIEEGEGGPRTRLATVVGSGISYATHSTPWGTSMTATRDATHVLVASLV